jgi:hypothetical protein
MLEIKHLEKSFGSLVAVNDVSFSSDARRRVGADVHFSRVAAAGDARRPGALGGRRLRRDDLARHRPRGAVGPVLALLGFATLFAAIAAARFRWEEA